MQQPELNPAVVQIVGETLRAMQVLLDRLSALHMMLLQKPVVSGHYTSAPYHNMLQPLDQFVRAVMESAIKLGALTAELLSEGCTDASFKAVQAQIKQLELLRYVLRHSGHCLLLCPRLSMVLMHLRQQQQQALA